MGEIKEIAARLQERAETCFCAAVSHFTSPELSAQQRMAKGIDMVSCGQRAIGEPGISSGGQAKVPSLLALFKSKVRPSASAGYTWTLVATPAVARRYIDVAAIQPSLRRLAQTHDVHCTELHTRHLVPL